MALAAALDDLCRLCVDRLPVDWAVVHLMTGDQAIGAAASSDERAALLGDVPFVTGEGPCLDAHRLRRPVLAPDLTAVTPRWPGFSSAMEERGVHAVFSVPMLVGAVGLGVVDLYAARAGALGGTDFALALAMGRVATNVLLTGGTMNETLDALGEAVDHKAEIYQAQGVLVVALGVPLLEAMVRLRAHAFALDLPLIELARMVLAGTTSAEDW